MQENNNQNVNKESQYFQIKIKKDFFKSKLFIGTLFAVIAISIGSIFMMNFNKLPKFNDDGTPIYYELDSNVYNNSSDYKGYYFKLSGKVFNVLGVDGDTQRLQMWLDPENSQYSVMVDYKSNDDIKDGDYIMCTGYISKIEKFDNIYGTELKTPLIYSEDLIKSSYKDVMAPTIKELALTNVMQKKYGYSIEINKIEFAENETRLYLTVINNGTAELNISTSAILVQNGKQFNTQDNWEANYEELSFDIAKGVKDEGILVFAPIEENDFKLMIDAWSENFDEDFNKFELEFKLNGKKEENQDNDEDKDSEKDKESDKTNNKTENTNSNNQSSTTETENQVDNYELAKQRAKTLAQEEEFPIAKSWLYEHLTSVEGYSSDEANYALNNANINWNEHAVGWANQATPTWPNDLKATLEDLYGFSDSEANYAANNCNINWNEEALNYVQYDLYKHLFKDEQFTKQNVLDRLLNFGYTQEQAQYAVDNANVVWYDSED